LLEVEAVGLQELAHLLMVQVAQVTELIQIIMVLLVRMEPVAVEVVVNEEVLV
jgi:hypothetical protein